MHNSTMLKYYVISILTLINITLIYLCTTVYGKEISALFLARDKSVWTTPGACTEETPHKPVAGEQSNTQIGIRPESTLMRAQTWTNSAAAITKLHVTREICSYVLFAMHPSTQKSFQQRKQRQCRSLLSPSETVFVLVVWH